MYRIWISVFLMLVTGANCNGAEIQATQQQINNHKIEEAQQPPLQPSQQFKEPRQAENDEDKKPEVSDNPFKPVKPEKVDKDLKVNTIRQRLEESAKSTEDINLQFRDIKIFILWGFAVIFSAVAILIGLIFWDRRIALINIYEIIRRLEKIEGMLREIVKKRI
ncbi:MAG: hypothetical protein HQK91_14165 [Nitrospirae bacterium]|nr:hypothetical protein [Nitrospirota bacterium]